MPRDSAGVMSLPPSTWATSGQTINVNQHNPAMREIEAALTDSLPRNGSAGMTAPLNMGGFQIKNIGAPVDAGDAVSLGFVGRFAPIGVILDYAGDTAPENWAFCFGQEFNRVNDAELFAVLGTKFGAGNGTTTFNAPDYRGRVGVGRDNMGGTAANRVTTAASGINGTGVGVSGGNEVQSLTVDQMPNHNHGGKTSLSGGHKHKVTIRGQQFSDQAGSRPTLGGANFNLYWETETDEAPNHEHNISDQGGGNPHNNMQPSLIVNKIIRVR